MFSQDVCEKRMRELPSRIKAGLLLFLGKSEAGINYIGNTYRFRQDSTFLYFFGLDEPDLSAVIDIDSGEEIIFGNDVTIDDIIWMGPQPLMSEKASLVGVRNVRPAAQLEEYLSRAKSLGRDVHFLPPY